MSDPNSQQQRKSATRTPEEIGQFLEKTGFVFEMRMNEVFRKAGYATKINEEFFDLEGDTLREIDIIASKVVNDINIHFVVECKQSTIDKWIFICHKSMPRYHYAVKHLPSVPVELLRENKPFSGFHNFDRASIPLAHNYLCYTIEGDKKGHHQQIDECVHKLPKAVVDLASRAEGGRHLYLPLALFSGQMFAVFYKNGLVVEESPFLQYYVSFGSEIYTRRPKPVASSMHESFSVFPNFESTRLLKSALEERIRSTTRRLSSSYQLDFVTEVGLTEYLARIEKQVAAVQTKDWPLPETPEAQVAESVTPK